MVQAVISTVLGGCRKYAEMFVCVAWLFLLLSIVYAVVIGLSKAIPLTYFKLHPDTPIDQALSDLSGRAVIVAALTAALSLVALLTRIRAVATIIVVAAWLVFPIYAGVMFSAVEPGPHIFQKSLGPEKYAIPWQFGPTGQAHGFSVRVCPDDLQGAYGISCLSKIPSIQLFAHAGKDATASFEMQMFERALPQMSSVPGLYGHQKAYIHTVPPLKAGRQETISRYYLRYDENERPVRLVRCSGYGLCEHVAAVGNYVLRYTLKESEFVNWTKTDERFASLIESWHVN